MAERNAAQGQSSVQGQRAQQGQVQQGKQAQPGLERNEQQPLQQQQQRQQPMRGMQRRETAQPTTYGRSSPFGMMRRMMEDMDRLFEDFGFGGRSLAPSGLFPEIRGVEAFDPAIEVMERDGKLFVRADLPGVKKEDVRVHVDENGLLIEGERKSEREENREGYFHSERSYGSFQRRIPLPRGADASTCDASFVDGVLEVQIELPKENRRRIEVRGGEERGAQATKH